MMRMRMALGVDLAVAMPVVTWRDGVEIEARLLDGGLHLGAITLRVIAGQRSPGLHRAVRARMAR